MHQFFGLMRLVACCQIFELRSIMYDKEVNPFLTHSPCYARIEYLHHFEYKRKRVWKDKSGLVSTSNFYGPPVIKQFKQRAKRELLRRKCISGEHRRLDVLGMEVKIFRNANWKREMFAQTNWNSSIFYSSHHDFHVTNIRNLKDQLKNLKKMFNQKCLRRIKPTSSQSLESYLKPFNDVWFTLELILTNGTQTKYQRSWCRSKTKCLMS